MKIIHVNLARGFRGGERQTQLLIQGLAAAGHSEQVLVCRPDSPLRQKLRNTPGLTFWSATHLLNGHRRISPTSLVHAHEGKAAHWAFIQRIMHQTPYIITRRVPNLLKSNLFTKMAYAHAQRLVAISTPIQKYLRSYIPSRPQVELIPSAWTPWTHEMEVIAALRREYHSYFVVGHVGALMDRHKGQSHLIEAAQRLEKDYPQMRFLFLGSGPDWDMLEQMAADCSNIRFLGFQKDVGAYLSIMDLFVFPSNYEGLGSILLDAMDCEVPVIATAVGGIPDLVQDKQTGLLVPAGDPQAIVQAIVYLYHKPKFRRRLASQAKAQLEGFSPAVMVQRYQELYQSLSR